MFNHRIQRQSAKNKTIKLTGGLNTEVASMEKPPGELGVCINYMDAPGSYSGYQSLKGYERYDGQTLASSIARETYTEYAGGPDYVLNDRVYVTVGDDDLVFYCIQAAGSGSNAPDSGTPASNTWWSYEGLAGVVDEYTDRKREAQRALITAVPGSGAIRGLATYQNDVYAWRNNAGATAMALYKSTTGGWSIIAGTTMTTPSGTIKSAVGAFALYNSNAEALFWVDGVTQKVHVWNGSAASTITHASLPALAPVNIGIWENRLFVVYATGSIFFSQVGDPTNFDASTGYAGEIAIGKPVTNLKPVAGKLVIFTKSKIKVLHYGSTTDQFIFQMDDFSDDIGALENTVQSMYETLYFCDDRGPNQLLTSAETGGFSAQNIGEKVETEFRNNKANITGSLVDVVNRRYYVFYTSGSVSYGLIFTIAKGKLKGIGRFQLDHKGTVVAHGIQTDGTQRLLFGNDSGMVYLMESGTSFDGDLILTRFITSYYHYGSPRHWKQFLRLHFEIDCGSQLPFTTGVIFDYGTPLLPNVANQAQTVSGGSSVWGGGIVWGSFTWGAGVLGRGISYITGYGTNMAVLVQTETKYFDQHTIHNLTTDYLQGGLQQ